MLDKYYGCFVSKMYVVCLHPDNFPDAFVDRVPIMEKETQDMMAYQRSRRSYQVVYSVEDITGGATTCSNLERPGKDCNVFFADNIFKNSCRTHNSYYVSWYGRKGFLTLIVKKRSRFY